MGGWIDEVLALLRAEPDWDEWDLISIPYNGKNGFDVQPLFVRALNKPGPIVVLEKVQSGPLANLREKLGVRVVIQPTAVADPADIWTEVGKARRRHEVGEPLLARKFVVAVLIVRKLRNLNRWAGKDKGYLWHFDLAKGRGVDEEFADIVEEVANDLLQHEVLIEKTSQGKKKYALNPARKPEVHAIAESAAFWNASLEEVLLRDHNTEPARRLTLPNVPQQFSIQTGDEDPFHYTSPNDAVAHARGCADAIRYEAKVKFRDGREMVEIIEEKRVLVLFFEEYL